MGGDFEVEWHIIIRVCFATVPRFQGSVRLVISFSILCPSQGSNLAHGTTAIAVSALVTGRGAPINWTVSTAIKRRGCLFCLP